MIREQTDDQRLAALQEQAAQKAPGDEAAAASAMLTFLTFRVGARWLALPANIVREVVVKGFVTRVPMMPLHVLGVMLIRNRLIPVISLEQLLDLDPNADLTPTLPRLVIIETAELEMALVADEVRELTELPRDEHSTLHCRTSRPTCVHSERLWNDRLLCILDPSGLVQSALGEEASR